MAFSWKRMSFRHKNNKFSYYLGSYVRMMIPSFLFRPWRRRMLRIPAAMDPEYIRSRVDYYNRLQKHTVLQEDAIRLCDLKLTKKRKVYYFDVIRYSKYFDPRLKAHFLFGDINYIAPKPSIVKSRPIHGDVSNSVVMKLVKIRHFTFVQDQKSFLEKRDMLVGRANVNQEHRARFYEMYFDHPMCDLGQVSHNHKYEQWQKPRMTLTEQLEYKFVLCIEGYDVASSLKWVMSSNSLAVSPALKYETWFMEGALIPNYHYVLIKDDYSDLEEQMNYYIQHPDEAQQIIDHAHEYVRQFMNSRQENLISMLVLQKYFEQTGQM